jgi:hypothetical protein
MGVVRGDLKVLIYENDFPGGLPVDVLLSRLFFGRKVNLTSGLGSAELDLKCRLLLETARKRVRLAEGVLSESESGERESQCGQKRT